MEEVNNFAQSSRQRESFMLGSHLRVAIPFKYMAPLNSQIIFWGRPMHEKRRLTRYFVSTKLPPHQNWGQLQRTHRGPDLLFPEDCAYPPAL